MITELKRIPFEDKKFTANGVEYFIEEQLSFDRLEMYEKLEVEVGLSMRLESIYKKLDEQKQALSAGNLYDAIVINNELQTSAYFKLEHRMHPVFEMCALFMNTADEDRSVITKDMISKKYSDWRQEYSVQDFFSFAIASMKNYISAYAKNSLSTSLTELMTEATKN